MFVCASADGLSSKNTAGDDTKRYFRHLDTSSSLQDSNKQTDLLAGLTSVRLLSAVRPLVPLHVVLLNETHVALITAEWLLS